MGAPIAKLAFLVHGPLRLRRKATNGRNQGGRFESHQFGLEAAISVIFVVTRGPFERLWAQGVDDGAGDRLVDPHMSGLGLVNLKKLIVLLVVAFLLFFLITQPTGSANTVDTILNWLKDGATAIVTFVRSLFA